MGFEGFGLGQAKIREGATGEWIGPGNHRLKIDNAKQKKGDVFIEFVVVATRDRGSNATKHAVGDKVSYKFGIAGTGTRAEMALSDFKTFLAAVVTSCGRDVNKIAAGQWEQIADNLVAGKANGVHVDCGAWYLTDKNTGEVINFTRVAFAGAPGGADVPALFEGFGFGGAKPPAASAAPAAGAPRPGARPAAQAVDPAKRAEVLEALREWQGAGLDRAAVTDAAGEYSPWATGLVGPSAYAALVAEVYG